MGLEGKIEADVELKSPADLFFKRLSEELHHLPEATTNVHGVEIHEGDHKTPGSVKEWSYSIDGKKEIFKERLEVDKEAKSFSMVAVGGHILQQYKSYKIVYHVFSSNHGPAILKAALIYEKFKDTDGDPHNYLQLLTGLMKDLDEHLIA